MSKQDIIEKIKKAKRLAEKGVDGEKESAQKRVEEMMQRYGITEADLDEEKKSCSLIMWKAHGVGDC